MTWKDGDFVMKAYCIAQSYTGSRLAEQVEAALRQAYEAGKKAERRSADARAKTRKAGAGG